MKPILSVQVQRGNGGDDPAKTLNEWKDAASHLTVDGLRAFEQRQRDRIKAAQQRKPDAKVTELKRGKA